MKNIYNDKKICIRNGKGFKLKDHAPDYNIGLKDESRIKKELDIYKEKISDKQEQLFAQDKYSVLIILQAIDTAGKDSCIKHVLSGVNPQGCHVVSFKQPNKEELDHEFLWRTNKNLPEKGKIGVFNRSYYEEVLITRVHQEYIIGQRIPGIETKKKINSEFWNDRYRIINEMERHLVKNGTKIIKIFLNLSKNEQKNRFLERIDDPKKNWKFSYGDLQERKLWDNYQDAYEQMIRNTSSKHAPWYVVPADNQWLSRVILGEILLETLSSLKLHYPALTDDEKKNLVIARAELMAEE